MEEKILTFLAESCDNKEITTNLDLELMDSQILDSLAFITFLNLLEDELNLEIQPTEYAVIDWKTPRTILSIVINELAKNSCQ